MVIEDLISTGGSSLQAVAALREAGLEVKGLVSIFTYDFEVAKNNFSEANCSFETLTDYHSLIEKAVALDYVSEKDMESLQAWRENPSEWGK